MVMEVTWDNDINSKIAWFYDQEHDEEFEVFEDLHPDKTHHKTPIEVKFFEMEYNSLSKDEVAHHITFKPSFDYHTVIKYYDEKFKEPLNSQWPIGMYCDSMDSHDVYHRWLVVGEYRHYSNQFPSYLVLPCNHKLQWIYKGVKYESWCCLKSQNSYNSGVWTDYKFTTPQNQKIIWLPFNDKTQNIFYDERIVISEPREEPIVWSVSKIEDTNSKGIIQLTVAQDKWNSHTDYIERDENNKVIGLWANYFDNSILPLSSDDPIQPNKKAVITYNGISPEIKIGGSGKKFSVQFYDTVNDSKLPFQPGNWKFTIDDNDVSDLLDITYPNTDNLFDDCQIEINFIGSDDYIGKTLTIRYISDISKGADFVAGGYVEMAIIGL